MLQGIRDRAAVQADSEWLYVVPWGLRKLLVWIHKRYNGPDIYVLENGVDCPKESSVPLPGQSYLPLQFLLSKDQRQHPSWECKGAAVSCVCASG